MHYFPPPKKQFLMILSFVTKHYRHFTLPISCPAVQQNLHHWAYARLSCHDNQERCHLKVMISKGDFRKRQTIKYLIGCLISHSMRGQTLERPTFLCPTKVAKIQSEFSIRCPFVMNTSLWQFQSQLKIFFCFVRADLPEGMAQSSCWILWHCVTDLFPVGHSDRVETYNNSMRMLTIPANEKYLSAISWMHKKKQTNKQKPLLGPGVHSALCLALGTSSIDTASVCRDVGRMPKPWS